MKTQHLRLFFAIDLAEETKTALETYMKAQREHLEKYFPERHFRWVKVENLHLTLQFLAAVKAEDVKALVQAVKASLQGKKAFQFEFTQAEWFPTSYLPHILSLQAEPETQLAELAYALKAGIEACAYPTERRPYRAHLTLARVEGLKNLDPALLEEVALPALSPQAAKEITLFQSQLQAPGSLYTAMTCLALEK